MKPVAITDEGMGGVEWLVKPLPDDVVLYAGEWVDLTEADIDAYALDQGVTADKAPPWLVKYARDIAAIVKEKNYDNSNGKA